MSAIAAALGHFSGAPTDPVVRRLLRQCVARGTEVSDLVNAGRASLGVGRHRWETASHLGGPAEVAKAAGIYVVADAALYYENDLAAGLRAAGVDPPGGPGTAEWILAAYRAWGVAAVERLEGDFAFVVWDSLRRRLFAARDFAGTRPLCYAVFERGVRLASCAGALADLPEIGSDLNILAVAEDAAGLNTDTLNETCFRRVARLPAGWALTVGTEGRVQAWPYWRAPTFESGSGLSFAEGAHELARLTGAAVKERCAPEGPTTVWMSGGYDSSAVFGIGRRALGARGRDLLPVSMSYPPGDPGREDEFIQAIAARWDASVAWVDSRRIPPLDQAIARARTRDEPMVHAFEMWNRALVAGTRRVEGRIALTGNGGDQLFQVSRIFLADEAEQGRWLRLWREGREAGLRLEPKWLMRWVLHPNLPRSVDRIIAACRGGRPVRRHLVDPIPPWVDEGFVRRSGLAERLRTRRPRRTGESHGAFETAWYFEGAFGPRIIGLVSGFGLDGGVEVRSPLYDQRVVAFAAQRPRWERRSERETKRLLRASASEVLPEEVVAARGTRTGLPGEYLEGCLHRALATMVPAVLKESVLADFGVIDVDRYQEAWEGYCRHGRARSPWGASLYSTAATEQWLRCRDTRALVPAVSAIAQAWVPDAMPVLNSFPN